MNSPHGTITGHCDDLDTATAGQPEQSLRRHYDPQLVTDSADLADQAESSSAFTRLSGDPPPNEPSTS